VPGYINVLTRSVAFWIHRALTQRMTEPHHAHERITEQSLVESAYQVSRSITPSFLRCK
jgi:hypothetical protein